MRRQSCLCIASQTIQKTALATKKKQRVPGQSPQSYQNARHRSLAQSDNPREPPVSIHRTAPEQFYRPNSKDRTKFLKNKMVAQETFLGGDADFHRKRHHGPRRVPDHHSRLAAERVASKAHQTLAEKSSIWCTLRMPPKRSRIPTRGKGVKEKLSPTKKPGTLKRATSPLLELLEGSAGERWSRCVGL